MDNVQFLNAIRAVASAEYKGRIPTATQTNIQNIMTTIMDYSATKEEFTNTILNKIVRTKVLNKAYENSLKFFKKEPLPFGKTIEGVFVDLIKAKNFNENFGSGNNEATSLLAKEKAPVKVEYYSENFKHKYKLSISDEQLKSAFMSADGLSQMTQGLIRSATSSSEYDEYMMIKTLIGASVSKEVEIQGLFKLDENTQAKKITKTVQSLVNKFRFMSTEYNKQGVHTHCQPSDCVIITTPDQLANLNVELLATAFNVPYAEMPSRIVVIDSFLKADGTDDADTVCIVADMDLVQFRNTLDTWETFRNPDGLMTNMFHHVWGSACGCGFVNAVKIKNKTS